MAQLRPSHIATLVVAASLMLAACGGSGHETPLSSRAGMVAPSTSCRTGASASGQSTGASKLTRDNSCAFLFSDLRRYLCPPSFGTGPVNVQRIERSKACVRLPNFVIPARLLATGARILAARRCLTAAGVPVIGGLVFQSGGPHRPAGELDGEHLPVLIAFYVDQRQAQQAAPSVRENVGRFHGTFERDGAESLVWVVRPPAGLATKVQRCISMLSNVG